MNKKLQKIYFTVCCVLALSGSVNAQYILKSADHQFELFNYAKAIDLYEQAFRKKENLHTAERLAMAYAFINNYKQAESWYAIAAKMPGSKPENLLGYAKALQSNSKYNAAKVQYTSYIKLGQNISEKDANVWLASCDSASKWMKNPRQVEIINQKELNSPQSDWGSVGYNGAIVLTSDRTTVTPGLVSESPFLRFDGAKMPDQKIYGWTGNGYLKLYIKTSSTDSLKMFPLQTGARYHVGSATFTADGNTMYFTMTKIPESLKKIKNKPSTVNVSIYSSVKDASGNWGAPVAFVHNAINEYSVGDPFISGDGRSLYFSSNKPGGKGGTDIYVCLKNDTGKWGSPVNLEQINTAGNERSPFAVAGNNLYFASDGHVGMGSLDVFHALKNTAGAWQVENLGYPFNSPQDDFAFSLNQKSGVAHLSSNRSNGMGSDDIYLLDLKSVRAVELTGKIYDRKSKQPVAGALVTLTRINGGSSKVETDNQGKYKFSLSAGSAYTVSAEASHFRTDAVNLDIVSVDKVSAIVQDLHLEPIELEKEIRLENIYYDFEKWNVRPDAAIELDALVKIMKDNPTIWIEIESHTDSRGHDAFNLRLSQKRAESVVEYIISRGIDKNRIEAKGYGETRLINSCANGMACSEEEHQLNRRTEFKIVKQ
ncbi:OmpA family protein [Pedobacter sp. GR22-10]|uniref:OmpA family protein n=1 Tax=Pedobacter sp. GR22-10 TaxID=2994472 RepID=UPI0022463825|nr:OmpA family protein [Pedobacter sp. GR22-10]MCX2430674.1 OmpA family protein [Pedobacter sp. GR22-10]